LPKPMKFGDWFDLLLRPLVFGLRRLVFRFNSCSITQFLCRRTHSQKSGPWWLSFISVKRKGALILPRVFWSTSVLSTSCWKDKRTLPDMLNLLWSCLGGQLHKTSGTMQEPNWRAVLRAAANPRPLNLRQLHRHFCSEGREIYAGPPRVPILTQDNAIETSWGGADYSL